MKKGQVVSVYLKDEEVVGLVKEVIGQNVYIQSGNEQYKFHIDEVEESGKVGLAGMIEYLTQDIADVLGVKPTMTKKVTGYDYTTSVYGHSRDAVTKKTLRWTDSQSSESMVSTISLLKRRLREVKAEEEEIREDFKKVKNQLTKAFRF